MAIQAGAAEKSRPSLLQRAALLQWLTVAHGLFEGVGALIASHGADSVALLGFGLDSIIEVCSASVVLWRLASIARQGRWHLSELAGLRLVGTGFLVLATSIAYDAIKSLGHHEIPKETILGIVVAVLSVALMPILGQAKKKISGEIGSHSMRADAKQTHFCAFLAGITLVGLGLNSLFGWWWADSAAALLMVPIMGWEGYQAIRGKACGCCAH
jgi:divalent metal cation (Fe/Co/Zn/Cd) transporter